MIAKEKWYLKTNEAVYLTYICTMFFCMRRTFCGRERQTEINQVKLEKVTIKIKLNNSSFRCVL